ncbi:hypothetical protein [Dokdonia pacifica]|uniref:Uncharacterized protein n=1 Tax=Dokdonia pacifica TaxID=1627892 RepID=A0A239AI27_9FLAO|nr:hypothetical protein [Dokdonia pacifica]SNR95179.1 hypothetical protein SAMN06265376_104451 [Dokdonia pacifica]
MLKKTHADMLFEEILQEFPIEIAIEGQIHLERYLEFYDYNLYRIYTGDANLSNFYPLLNIPNTKTCPRRETLNNSLYHICDYILELKKLGFEMGNFDQNFDSFIRILLGWSPLVINTKGEGEPLSPNDLIHNKFKSYNSYADIIKLLIRHEHTVLDNLSFEELKKKYPESASKARHIVLTFIKKYNLNKNDLFLGETVFKSSSNKKNNLIYHASKEICHLLEDSNNLNKDKFSDVIEFKLKTLFGLPNSI